jgi:perosamine synthetase
MPLTTNVAPIAVNEPLLDGNEKRYVSECLDMGWISSEGPFVRRFEEAFAARVGRSHGIAVSSGSAALDVAVAALEIGPGDEVILPSFTIVSCAAAIVHAGATPVVVDSDPETWNLDTRQLEAAWSPRTRAVMPVHIYGLPVDMDPLLEFAARHRLHIIEDAAQMHGQQYRGRPCGSFGDLSVFSFYPNKHVTTGEGGMIVTDDAALAERCRSLRNLCFVPERRFVHDELGWNYRMSNLQAALGVAQLERLDEFVARKRRMGRLYRELLSDVTTMALQPEQTTYAQNIFWVFGVVLSDRLPFDASTAMARLAERRIGSRPFFWPMHEQPVFLKRGWFRGVSCPVAERIARRGFYIPSGLALSDTQIEQVALALREILQ